MYDKLLNNLEELKLEKMHSYIPTYLNIVAGFPFIKRYDEYDYDFQPSVNKNQIKDLCSLRFIENKENILFYKACLC